MHRQASVNSQMPNLNATPSGERVRIGFFGVRNAGKSSLVNALCNQSVSVVSNTAGTTTDAVRKAMELLPLGPVEIVDTPGIDDAGQLGAKRVRRAREVLRSCNVAVLVIDATRGVCAADKGLIQQFDEMGVPYVIAQNKADSLNLNAANALGLQELNNRSLPTNNKSAASVLVSARTGAGLDKLKALIAHAGTSCINDKHVVADIVNPSLGPVVLVVPIDSSAPKGRIILPQQMVLRDLLDAHVSMHVCQPEELGQTLEMLPNTQLVITDSQVFKRVANTVCASIALTSFSILMARYKGNLNALVAGAKKLDSLTNNSSVLIAEGCTHHRQCEDIGTVKLPAWVQKHCNAKPSFSFCSGREFPSDVSKFDLVIHCGGCMLNAREMKWRQGTANKCGVAMVNYGVAIAQVHGLLKRALAPLQPKANTTEK